jgi:hypothetical protein
MWMEFFYIETEVSLMCPFDTYALLESNCGSKAVLAVLS